MNNINSPVFGVVYSNDTCGICLENYQKEQKIIYTKCNHLFHKKCIEPWKVSNIELKRLDNPQNNNNVVADCPTCRNALATNMKEISVRKVKLISADEVIIYQLNTLIQNFLLKNTFIAEQKMSNYTAIEYYINRSKKVINVPSLNRLILNIIENHKNYSAHSLILVNKILNLVDKIDYKSQLYITLNNHLSKLSNKIASNIVDNIEYIEFFFKYNIITEHAITLMITHYICEKKFTEVEALIKNNNITHCIEVDALKKELLANITISNKTNVRAILALINSIDHKSEKYKKIQAMLRFVLNLIAKDESYNIEFIDIFLEHEIITQEALTAMMKFYICEKKFAKAEMLIKNNNASDCIEVDVLKDELLANININNLINVKHILALTNRIEHKSEKYKKIQAMLRFVLNLIAKDESYNIEFIDIFLEHEIITQEALTAIMRFSINDMDLYRTIYLQEAYNIDIDFRLLEIVMLENINNNNMYNMMQVLDIICDINRENVEYEKINQMLDNIINKIVVDHKKINFVNILQKRLQIFKDSKG
jgi:tetrahydromethanopterin S-methyltransferase subunit F